MTRIFTARHPAEAHLIQGLLQSKGITSELRGEALFGARGEIPVWEALPEIWVDEDQVSEALGVIQSQSSSDDNGPWECSNCGETVEAQFTACWKCKTERPEPAL
jgi:hypothetical protein